MPFSCFKENSNCLLLALNYHGSVLPQISMKDLYPKRQRNHPTRVRQTSQHKEGKLQANAHMRRYVDGIQACETVLGITVSQGNANIKSQGGNTSYQLPTVTANIKKTDNAEY